MKLSINKKDYGLQWGMGAIRLFCDKMDCEFEQGLEMILGGGTYTVLQRTKAVSTMVLCAIENYCRLNDETFDVTFFQIEDYRDNTSQEKFKLIMDDFTSSMILGNTISSYLGIVPEENKEVSKKKSRSLKS